MTLKTFHTGLMKLVPAHSFARERGANLYWYYGNVFHRLRTFSSLSFFFKESPSKNPYIQDCKDCVLEVISLASV